MNLYVWKEAYRVSYGNATLYVVASSLEEARVLASTPVDVSRYGMTPTDAAIPDPKVIAQEPRIIKGPCAEIQHFEE